MDFSQSIVKCISDYATFSGRSSRSEFWWFTLFTTLVAIVSGILDSTIFGMDLEDPTPFGMITSVILFMPAISVTVRRLHDVDRSGWWFWFFLVPIIGWITILVWECTRGTYGENKYGPDPLLAIDDQHSSRHENHSPEPVQTPYTETKKSEYTTPPTVKRR